MNINDICMKLVLNNKKQYAILFICLIVGTMLCSSLGLLVFSPVIKDNTAEGGTTRSIAYIIYGITVLGSIMFILYAHSLFMKYKSKEIGLFISLGMSRNNINKLLLRELTYILPLGAIIGILIGIPTVYLFWNIVTRIIGVTSMPYIFGWGGIVGGILVGNAAIFIIKADTTRYIKKTDIMSILRAKEKTEETKVGNYVLGIIGFATAFFGSYGWDRTIKGLWFLDLRFMSFVFALMVPTGLYLFVIQIGSFGELVKKISLKKYYKNIMFYNLLKLKGRQYANTLYAVIFLISITVFMSCISFVGPLAAEEIIEARYSFDYSIRRAVDQNYNITKEDIFILSNKYDIKIENYQEIELLQLAKIEEYGNDIFVWDMVCINEDEYNRIYNDNIDVYPGQFIMISMSKSRLQLKIYKTINAMVIGTTIEQQLIKQCGVHKILIQGNVSPRGDFFVLDGNDYSKLKSSSMEEAIETQIVFDVSNWKETERFYTDLKNTILLSNNNIGIKLKGGLIDKYYDGGTDIFEKSGITSKDYDNWKYKLEAKIAGFAEDRFKSIYYLLFIYIGILAIIASAMILFIKILNISWQDAEIYNHISLLGASRKYIKSLITKQLVVIFFVPTVIGMIYGIIIPSMMNSGMTYTNIFIKYAIFIDLIFLVSQIIMFLYTRHILINTIGQYHRKLFK